MQNLFYNKLNESFQEQLFVLQGTQPEQTKLATEKEITVIFPLIEEKMIKVENLVKELTIPPHEHDYDENGVCKICGRLCEHEYENGRCIHCGMIDPNHEHVYNKNGVCTICGKGCEHEYENGRCIYCGMIDPNHEHVYDENGICTICGRPCQHEFVDGVCIHCGAEDPNYGENEAYVPQVIVDLIENNRLIIFDIAEVEELKNSKSFSNLVNIMNYLRFTNKEAEQPVNIANIQVISKNDFNTNNVITYTAYNIVNILNDLVSDNNKVPAVLISHDADFIKAMESNVSGNISFMRYYDFAEAFIRDEDLIIFNEEEAQ